MFILGGITFSGLTVFAEYIVSADKIEYAPNVSVKDKIDDLYSKVKPDYTGNVEITPTKKEQTLLTNGKTLNSNITINAIPDRYIEPTGTLVINEKNSQINVNNYKYVDTSQLYTSSDVSGEGINWKKGTMTISSTNGSVNVGFKPSDVFIYGYNGSDYFEIHAYSSKIIRFNHLSNGSNQYLDISSALQITSTGFKYNGWGTGYTYNYIAIK